jgi:hypothetical protein
VTLPASPAMPKTRLAPATVALIIQVEDAGRRRECRGLEWVRPSGGPVAAELRASSAIVIVMADDVVPLASISRTRALGSVTGAGLVPVAHAQGMKLEASPDVAT